MAMLDRRPRRREAGSDDETVAIARKDFARRQRSRRWRRARPFVIAVLTTALVGGGVWLVYFSSVMTVSGVDVTGNSELSAARIEAAARVPRGDQLARVDLTAIQARVENVPAVKEADVSRSWPDTVTIAIVERVPVAAVDRGTGLQAVDDAGVLFNGYAERPKSLPLIRTAPDIRSEALAEAARVIAALPAAVANKVNFLDVRSVDRIELSLHDGRRVLWGSAEQSTQKAEVLAVLLQRKGEQYDVSVPARPTSR